MKVAIQGIAGSFHHQAAGQFFANDNLELVQCETFRQVFEAVKSGVAERGIVAIENSLHGSINPVYRLLAEQDLWICGEVRLKIELFLVGHAIELDLLNAPTSKVFSHTAALNESEIWLNTHLSQAQRQEMSDTAAAVQYVMSRDKAQNVAIAGQQAANLYKASVIAGPVNDDPENYTRFIVLAKEQIIDAQANRTSIILTEGNTDQAGSLFDALRVFKERKINLSKLDSHPLPGEQRRYAFYLDFDDNYSSALSKAALDELTEHGWKIDVLGSYKTILS